jgi:hypothetical protein
MFLGAFTLLVLPLFMLVCANMIKQSEYAKTLTGKILEIVFYIMAAAGFGTALYLFTKI